MVVHTTYFYRQVLKTYIKLSKKQLYCNPGSSVIPQCAYQGYMD